MFVIASTWSAVPPGASIIDAAGRAVVVGGWIDPIIGVRLVGGEPHHVQPWATVAQLVPDEADIILMFVDAGFTVEGVRYE